MTNERRIDAQLEGQLRSRSRAEGAEAMRTFNQDVVIVDHDLILQNPAGEEITRVDQNGNVVTRRMVGGALADALSFDASTGDLQITKSDGSVVLALDGGSGDLTLGGTRTAGRSPCAMPPTGRRSG